MANEVGEKRVVNPITLTIGEHKFKQDEILTILSLTNNKTTVAREDGSICTVPTTALLFATDKVS